jgi:hypothetical protein
MNPGARNEDTLGRGSNIILTKSLLSAFWNQFEKEFSRHRDCRFQTAIDRTLVGEDPVHSIGGFPVSFLGLKPQSHVNAADHEYIVLQFYLTQCFPNQAFI